MKKFTLFKVFFTLLLMSSYHKVDAFNVGYLEYADLGYNECSVVGFTDSQEPITNLEIPAHIRYNEMNYIVTQVGDLAFYGNDNIKSVSIPNTISFLNRQCFANCASLKEIIIEDGTEYLYPYDDIFNETMVETVYMGRNVGWVWLDNAHTIETDSPFKNMASLKYLTFGDKITYLDHNRFEGCIGLTEIRIPSNIITIDYEVFKNCNSLSSVIIEDGDYFIGMFERVFEGCPIESAYIGRDISGFLLDGNIPSEPSFKNMTSLKSLIFGSKVKTIYPNTFYGCSSLTELILPPGIETIYRWAFNNCSSLKKVIIENGENGFYPYDQIFDGCPIESVYLGRNMGWWEFDEGPEQSTVSPFKDMTTLKEVVIGPGAQALYFNVFEGCNSLKNVIVEDGNDPVGIWDGAFKGCPVEYVYMGRNTGHWSEDPTDSENGVYNGLKNITTINKLVFGPLVTLVDYHAFEGCSGLTSLTFPDNIRELWAYSFKNCDNLTEISIGSEMDFIEKDVFAGCDKLNKIVCGAMVPPSALESSFPESVYSTATLIVDINKSDLYRNTYPWSRFNNIIESEIAEVNEIILDNEVLTVYDITGRCVLENAAEQKLKTLNDGLYIINGKKVIIINK